jgi:hypothetical protein
MLIENKFEVETQFECHITYKFHNFQTSFAFLEFLNHFDTRS